MRPTSQICADACLAFAPPRAYNALSCCQSLADLYRDDQLFRRPDAPKALSQEYTFEVIVYRIPPHPSAGTGAAARPTRLASFG